MQHGRLLARVCSTTPNPPFRRGTYYLGLSPVSDSNHTAAVVYTLVRLESDSISPTVYQSHIHRYASTAIIPREALPLGPQSRRPSLGLFQPGRTRSFAFLHIRIVTLPVQLPLCNNHIRRKCFVFGGSSEPICPQAKPGA